MPPPPGTAEEPQWLQQRRRARPVDIEWTEQLDDVIAQVRTFQFRLASLSLVLVMGHPSVHEDRQDGELYEVDDPNAFLLLLEGLD